jgi:ribosomal protein S18
LAHNGELPDVTKSSWQEARIRNEKALRPKRNLLRQHNVTIVDWKDTALLRKFISDRDKIHARGSREARDPRA